MTWDEDTLKRLDGIIRYHERIIMQSKVRELPSIQTLEEFTVQCLKELKETVEAI